MVAGPFMAGGNPGCERTVHAPDAPSPARFIVGFPRSAETGVQYRVCSAHVADAVRQVTAELTAGYAIVTPLDPAPLPGFDDEPMFTTAREARS